MHRTRFAKWVSAVAASALGLMLVMSLAGCGDRSDKSDEPASTDTARANFAVAESSVTSMAPDAKLLVVQTAQSVTSTATPVWSYLFGSPESDKTYLALASQGQSLGASEYGTGGLTAEEWGEVPNLDTWKIDSDTALEKALKVSGAQGDPRAYVMGFQTYIPSSTSSKSQAFRWYIALDPGESGATTSTIGVDAKTGEAAIVK